MDSDHGKNAWYPRHASDRADVLLDELEEEQVDQLLETLHAEPYSTWMQWLEDKRAAIAEYDSLTATGRKRRLKGPDVPEALKLHHACVFLELWRVRLETRHMSLPPRGSPLDTPLAHRGMLLHVLAAYNQAHIRDFWPFSGPPGPAVWPFGDEPDRAQVTPEPDDRPS